MSLLSHDKDDVPRGRQPRAYSESDVADRSIILNHNDERALVERHVYRVPRKLAPKQKHGVDEAALRRLWASGANRKAIAHDLGITLSKLNYWREFFKLPTRTFKRAGSIYVHLDERTYSRVTMIATARRMSASRFLRLLILKGLPDG